MMNLKNIILLILIFFLMFGLNTKIMAKKQDIPDIADNILTKYRNIEAIQTKFIQILISKTTNQKEERKGEIFCKRDTDTVKVRWEIKWPEKEILIVSGDIIWDYFPEDKIAYKYRLSKMEQSRTIFDILTGRLNLKEKFDIQLMGIENGLTKLKLIPIHPEPNMVVAYLTVDKSFLIKKINIIDFFGNKNIIEFEKVSLNPALRENLFWEQPPHNIQIVEGNPTQSQ